jgi:uncharacterized protein YjbJ (UPF0337 family)
VDDKAKGKAKEAWGALTGDEEETAQKQRTSQAKKEARQAEQKRDGQKVKDEGLLGGVTDVTDSLSGRDKGSR